MTNAALAAVAVFCGSRSGRDGAYLTAARQLGEALAAHNLKLVYGGSSAGLMGAVADATLAAGGSATGVIPRALTDREQVHPNLTELHFVDSMHERKLRMAEAADAFIALPGGFGTLDETFEALTWTQLGIHRKPLGLFNVAGYYDKLLAFIDDQVAAGFVAPDHRSLLIDADEARPLLEALASQELPERGKWRATPEA
ncbi:MAG: TIGR00730 family Rossman fold protein [Pseudomonadota bacterium]